MSPLLQVSSILLGAALTAWFAVRTYFRQREHELILSRYLEGSLDLLAAEVSDVSEAFHHNWARCLAILKSYRDLEDEFDVTELSAGFVEVWGSKHNVVAHHRLYTLTGTKEYWEFYQEALAFFMSANSVLVKEIPEVIRVKLESGRVDRPHSEIVEEAFQVARQKDEESHRYIQLIGEFQSLSAALESERYRFRNLKEFRRKTEVRESISRTREMLHAAQQEES